MKTIRYSYAHAPTLLKFSECDRRIAAVMGPFGSGKSSACVAGIIERSMRQSPSPDGIRRTRWAVVRNTYGQLKDTTIKTFHEWLPPEHFGEWRVSDMNYNITGIEGAEIEVWFRALDDPKNVRNLLSMELTGAWVNEAREVPWTIIDALEGRCGRFPKRGVHGVDPTWYGILMDTNPPDDMSQFYNYFEEKRLDKAMLFKQPSGLSVNAENLPFLPPGYYSTLAEGKDDEYIKIYIHGQYGFLVDGKPVYQEYNDTLHCHECTPVKAKRIRRGWDFGLTPACTFSQMTPSGHWIVFDELVATSMGIENFSEEVLAHCAQHLPGYKFEDFADPAGTSKSQTDEKTCFEIMRGKNITPTAGEPTLLRIESVRHALTRMAGGKPMFVLHPRCKILRRGFMGGYKYKIVQGANDRYHEEPDKNQFSHPHDALQYDASMLFGKAVLGRERPKWDPIKYANAGIV